MKEDDFVKHIQKIVTNAIPGINSRKIVANAKCHKVDERYLGLMRVMKKYASTIIEADLKVRSDAP